MEASEKINNRLKCERGSVMIESVYCIIFVMFMSFFLLSFGFFLYEKAMFDFSVNQIAEDVVMTYKLEEKHDTFSASQITEDAVKDVAGYRYFIWNNSVRENNESKLEKGIVKRLSAPSFQKREGDVFCTIKQVDDDIGRRHYEVTVSQNYSFMLSQFLSFIGIHDGMSFEKTVYVEGVDMLDYVNSVKYVSYVTNKMKSNSSVFGLIDSFIKMVQSFANIGRALKN